MHCPHDHAPHGGLTCDHVADGAPVLAVFRYLDGEQAFTCGLPHDADHVWRPLCVACAEAARRAHPPLLRLPKGFAAWRAHAGTDIWHIDPIPAEGEDDLDYA
ncbi:MAG: hypothetical protein AAGI51_12230 [Pseudomonadota bacterium]